MLRVGRLTYPLSWVVVSDRQDRLCSIDLIDFQVIADHAQDLSRKHTLERHKMVVLSCTNFGQDRVQDR